jgi:hypothetical protein
MATAATLAPATPGFATMVTAAPIAVELSAVATGVRWTVGGFEILFVGLLVPIAILVVGAPIALLVRAVVELASRF